MGFLSGIIGKLIGRFIGGGSSGSACPAIPFISLPHKFFKRFSRKKTEHGCQTCGGTGRCGYTPIGGTMPAWRKCMDCDGTGEDPNNKAPRPPDGLSRRQRKQWLKDHQPEVAPWAKSTKFVRLPTKMCARGCGALNPVWVDTDEHRPQDEKGVIWKILGWVYDRFMKDGE